MKPRRHDSNGLDSGKYHKMVDIKEQKKARSGNFYKRKGTEAKPVGSFLLAQA